MLVLIKYGFENLAERWKLEVSGENDTIVLIQNGIFWAISQEIDPYLNRKIFALEPDMEARGYSKEDLKVPVIDYAGLVDLIEANPRSMG